MEKLSISGSVIVKNSTINIIGYILPALFLVFATPYIVNGFGTERYAVLSVSWILIGYFAVFDLGLGTATTKFVTEALHKGEAKNVPSVLWSAVLAQLVLGAIAATILISLVPWFVAKGFSIPVYLQDDARHAFYLSALFIPIAFISNSFVGLLVAVQRFDLVNLIKIPSQLAIYAAAIIGVHEKTSITAVILIIVVIRLILLVFSSILCSLVFQGVFKISFSKKVLKRLTSFGGWLTISNSVNPVMFYVDRLLIGSVLGMSALTFYTVPFDLAARVWFLSTSLSMTLFPAFSALMASGKKDQAAEILMMSIKYLTLLSGPVVCLIAAYSPELFKYWIGSQFVIKSTPVLQVLLISTLVDYPSIVSCTLLEGTGRPRALAIVKLLYLPVHVLICYLALRWFGIVGAAASVFIMRIVYACVFTYTASGELDIPYKTLISKLLSSYCLQTVLILVCIYMANLDIFIRTVGIICIFCAYLVITFKVILGQSERETLVNYLQHMISKVSLNFVKSQS